MSGMGRREFVALLGGAAAWPVTVQAQQSERVRQIGVLMGTSESDLDQKGMVSTFTRALADLGWMEGTNIRIERRWAEGNFARLRTHALDLARHAAQVAPSRRGGRPAERSGRPATHVDDVTKNMANPHRDADAAVVQPRCVPAAGKSTRAGRRERDLSSRLGSLHSSRFVTNQRRGM
jgi:hypothetical protein